MVEQLFSFASSLLSDLTTDEVSIQVTYDYETGTVTYDQQSISITASTRIFVELNTVNVGPAGDARFYGFTVSPNWPAAIQLTFPGDQEIQLWVPLPDTPDDSFSFLPSIQATGAPIDRQGTIRLDVGAV
jgi:hypothetical protein